MISQGKQKTVEANNWYRTKENVGHEVLRDYQHIHIGKMLRSVKRQTKFDNQRRNSLI